MSDEKKAVVDLNPASKYARRKKRRQLISQMNNTPNGQFSLFPTDPQNFAPMMQRRDFMPSQGVHLPNSTANSQGVLLTQPTPGTLPATEEEDEEIRKYTHSRGVKLAPLEILKMNS